MTPDQPFRRTPAETVAAAFEALGRRDIPGVTRYMHPDMVDEFPTQTCRGTVAIASYFAAMFASFPDARITVDRIVADDTHAVVAWTLRGTFTGVPFEGVQATGRALQLPGVDVIEVRDGLEIHNVISYDTGSFMRQIGLLPPVNSLGERTLRTAFNLSTRTRRMLEASPRLVRLGRGV